MGIWKGLQRAYTGAIPFILMLFVFLGDEDCSSATRLPSQKLEILDAAEHPYALPPELKEEARINLRNWFAYVKQTSDFDDSYEPWVDKNTFKPRRTIVVAQDGSGNFLSIQEAVNSIPVDNGERVLIHVKAGYYWFILSKFSMRGMHYWGNARFGLNSQLAFQALSSSRILPQGWRKLVIMTPPIVSKEKVRIMRRQHFITIEGEMDDRKNLLTTIAYNSTAANVGNNGLPLKTFNSSTFATNGRNFIARNLIFKNTAPTPIPGEIGGQAVALRVSGDKSAFYGCKFYGNQDTLYDHKGRHFFGDCYVEGTVDFVFGNGRSLYKNCHLNALPTGGSPGFLTAQKVSSTLETGFSFVNSKITGYGSTYLGRAWGNDSRVVFANTFMDDVVVPEGWNDWGIPDREKSVFYAEFNCTGPGANTSGRAHWSQQLTYEQARPFLSVSYVNGRKWLQYPETIDGARSPTWGPGLGPHDNATSGPYQINKWRNS